MAKSIDIYIDQGIDFTATFPPVTSDGQTVVNLTGYTAMAQLRRGYSTRNALQFDVEITNPTSGIISISLSYINTAALPNLRYVYDVIIIGLDGGRQKVFEGLCIVNPGVTDKPNTILAN